MKIYLKFIAIFILITKNSISTELDKTKVYNFEDCYNDGFILDIEVDLNKKTINLNSVSEGYILPEVKLNIETINEGEIKSNKFLANKFLNVEGYTYGKWQKIAMDYTSIYLKIFTDKKKVNLVYNSLNTNNKEGLKAIKKIFGGTVVNMAQEFPCLSLLVKDITSESQQLDIDENNDKIIPAASGSGFVISNYGHIVTNFHVIDKCEQNIIYLNGKEFIARVLSIDKINDLAILKITYNPKASFPISREDVSLLEDVIVAGFPLGKNVSAAIKTHKGVVTSLAGAGDNYSNFQTDADINQGNSGGPIVDQKGNVVGVAVATWIEEGVEGVNFGIKSSTLQTFLRSNGINLKDPSTSDLSNKDLGKLITNATTYIECHMTVANIKKMINDNNNRKAFFRNIEQ